MKRLLSFTVALFTLALAGCGEESDKSPVDGRDFDAEDYSEPEPYTGRVIDGYLRNARVWLDMDGDSQYTPGPMTFDDWVAHIVGEASDLDWIWKFGCWI